MNRESIVVAFEFATKHFFVLSVMIGCISYLFTNIYVGSYLDVYDPEIGKFIEYADLTKLALSFSGIFIVIGFFAGITYALYNIRYLKPLQHRTAFLIVLALIFVVADYVDLSVRGNENDLSIVDHAMGYLPMHVAMFSAVAAALFPNVFSDYRFVLFIIFPVMAVLTGIQGTHVAKLHLAERDVSYDVFLKPINNHTTSFHDVSIVMALSHHTIIYMDGKAIVIQTPDIEEIRRRPKSDK